MVLRPIRAGVLRLSECNNHISFIELFNINLALDEEETKGGWVG